MGNCKSISNSTDVHESVTCFEYNAKDSQLVDKKKASSSTAIASNTHDGATTPKDTKVEEQQEKAQDNLVPRDVPIEVSTRSLMSITSSLDDTNHVYEQDSSRSLLQQSDDQNKSFQKDSNQQDHEAFQIFRQLRRISNERQNSVTSIRSQTQTLTMDQLHNEHETEEAAQERRKRFIDAFQIKQQAMWNNKTSSMQMIENKAIDWSENYATMNKMRSMNEFFEQMRDNILQDEQLRNAIIRKHLRRRAWMESFVKLDPRFQIHAYFTEVAREGGPLEDPLVSAPMSVSALLNSIMLHASCLIVSNQILATL